MKTLVIWLVIWMASIIFVLVECGTPAPPASPTQPEKTPTESVRSLPDFVIVGSRWSPLDPAPNTPVTFNIMVQNFGSAHYKQYIRVDGPGFISGGFTGLLSGETKEATIEFRVGCPVHGCTANDIYFEVDPDNLIQESDETNNRYGPLSVVFGGG